MPIRSSWMSPGRSCRLLSRRNLLLACLMSALLVGLVALIYFLSQKRGSGGEPATAPLRWTTANATGGCPSDHFRCAWRCVALFRRCDGRADCPRAEDEVGCPCAFRMPAHKFCDAHPDCPDASDESLCAPQCPPGEFRCEDGGRCVAGHSVCDGRVDCDDFSDENDCYRLWPRAPFGLLLRRVRGAWLPLCANPHDSLQPALAGVACASLDADPLATGTASIRPIPKNLATTRDFAYHYQGRFVRWRGCLTGGAVQVRCAGARCGADPRQLLFANKGRIVGGEQASPAAWPWHAAVYKNGSYSCGATLISDRWLVSAAHCFLNALHNYYEVQLGTLRRRSFSPHQRTLAVDRIISHHKFNVVTLEFDIALLRTVRPIAPFTRWVRPLCLPPEGGGTPDSGALCTAVGWGDTGEYEDDSEALLEVRVPVTPRRACKRDHNRWVCAGPPEGGRDACQGDSGGPLMCPRPDGLSWYLAGVISGGTGCARPKTPGMYTRVGYFADWIRVIIEAAGEPKGALSPLSTCPGWRCPVLGGGTCLSREKVCDEYVDCFDAQDEVNCTRRK